MNNWELIKTDNVEWCQDGSGVHTIINWIGDGLRVDVMGTADGMPIMSFQGTEHNVRITLMHWLSYNIGSCNCPDDWDMQKGKVNNGISLEHAAYIGRELTRCDIEKHEYVQD